MTKQDKELLLRDLCARLPYGVKIERTLYGAITLTERLIESFRRGFDDILIPYLRPMSSMTNDEYKEMNDIIGWHAEINYKYSVNDFEICLSPESDPTIWFGTIIEIQDWLNVHHFDYRGLIDKGLAIKVTRENNPYKD